jgi:hypothetical protein
MRSLQFTRQMLGKQCPYDEQPIVSPKWQLMLYAMSEPYACCRSSAYGAVLVSFLPSHDARQIWWVLSAHHQYLSSLISVLKVMGRNLVATTIILRGWCASCSCCLSGSGKAGHSCSSSCRMGAMLSCAACAARHIGSN